MAEKKRKLAFGTPEWMEDRERELDTQMQGHDFTKDVLFIFRWDGWIKFRVMPGFKPEDWFRPYGEHWNVFPGQNDKDIVIDGCPEINFGPDHPCPICYAINKALAEKKATFTDFFGMGGIGVQKKYLLPVMLLEANLVKSDSKQSTAPVFTDLPQVKILALPISVAKKFRSLLQDDDYGYEELTHPEVGVVLKLTKDNSQAGTEKYTLKPVVKDHYALPDDLFEWEVDQDENGEEVSHIVGYAEGFPELENFLPKTTGDELMAKIEKYQHDINPFVANFNLSIDISPGRKALPAGKSDDDDEKPSKKSNIAALKERMKKHKA